VQVLSASKKETKILDQQVNTTMSVRMTIIGSTYLSRHVALCTFLWSE